MTKAALLRYFNHAADTAVTEAKLPVKKCELGCV